jgi:DNA-binding response OmpR family regulator
MPPQGPRVIVADDDPGIRTILTRVLQLNGFEVGAVDNGSDALGLFERDEPTLLILDVRMPGMDGITLCSRIRASSNVPIIILTALEEEADAARALEAGADDYVRKPFGAAELVARVKAILRRSGTERPAREKLSAGPIILDEAEHVCFVNEEELVLSRTEFALLAFLIRNRNRVLTHDHILERVWGPEYVGSHHVLRVAMSRLRQRLEGVDANFIETLLGVGYRLKAS